MDRDARFAVPSYPRPVVLFDGVCRFCHWAVGLAIPRDRDAKLRFTSLQSAIGKRILDDQGIVDGTIDSVVLVDEEGCHVKSTAVLRIARRLSGPWPLLCVFMILPRSLRDWVYDRVAAWRYRWFGTYASCPLPSPEVRARFLD
jgi:predicted DCC family thiol-disulfide oxidoreductase YuxK